ncbi:hypothetical protein FJ208_01140 [Candidatus Gribaldobacteria bacterium]|nr:hypothetical protein [Candidatus Gribaldobacteria bacterium]
MNSKKYLFLFLGLAILQAPLTVYLPLGIFDYSDIPFLGSVIYFLFISAPLLIFLKFFLSSSKSWALNSLKWFVAILIYTTYLFFWAWLYARKLGDLGIGTMALLIFPILWIAVSLSSLIETIVITIINKKRSSQKIIKPISKKKKIIYGILLFFIMPLLIASIIVFAASKLILPPKDPYAKALRSMAEIEMVCFPDGHRKHNAKCNNSSAIISDIFLYPLPEVKQINYNLPQHHFYFYTSDSYDVKPTSLNADLLLVPGSLVSASIENNVMLLKKIADKAKTITKPIPIQIFGKIKISENCAEFCQYSYYILLDNIFFNDPVVVNPDLDLAEETLIKYFDYLNKGNYEEAVKYHGSGYDYMSSCQGIDVDASKKSDILKCGCEYLQCEKIKFINHKKIISPEEFEFTVEFRYSDGPLEGQPVVSYKYCCGQEPPVGEFNIPKTEFEYRVKKIGNKFFITTPILYIP